ncbi:hypothetical protein ABPG74_008018 [Tetrahymena malaccensis]
MFTEELQQQKLRVNLMLLALNLNNFLQKQNFLKSTFTDHVHLQIDYVYPYSQSLSDLSLALEQCINLITLRIYLCEFYKIDDKMMFDLLSKLVSCPQLQMLDLDLDSCNISQKCILEVSSGVDKLVNLQNLILNLDYTQKSNNRLNDQQVLELASGISKLTNLSSLCFSLKGNKITKKGAQNLTSSLTKCRKIENFRNKIKDEGVQKIGSELLKFSKLSYLSLSLCNNQITNEGVKNLCNSLSKCSSISKLSLGLKQNTIGDEGITDLAYEFAQCYKLSSLKINLFDNYIGETGIFYLVSELKNCPKLINLQLNFEDSKMNDQTVKDISSGLLKCQNIENSILNLYWKLIWRKGKKYDIEESRIGILYKKVINIKILINKNVYTFYEYPNYQPGDEDENKFNELSSEEKFQIYQQDYSEQKQTLQVRF